MCKVIEDLMNEEKRKIAINLNEQGLSVDQIASALKLTVAKVEEFINGEAILA